MRSRSALTLIEVLLSALILCVGLLGLLGAIPGLLRAGNQVALDLAVDQQAESVFAALREGARAHTHVRWSAGTPRQPERVCLLLPHPAAGAVAPDPHDPRPLEDQLLEDRGCLVLPWGRDEVLVYPRAGSPAEVAAANAALAPADLGRAQGATALYLLPAGELEAGLGFAIRVQRGRVGGRPQDGLYLITLLFFRVPAGADADPEQWALTASFTSELAAGPGPLVLPAPAPAPEVADPRDWQDTLRWSASR